MELESQHVDWLGSDWREAVRRSRRVVDNGGATSDMTQAMHFAAQKNEHQIVRMSVDRVT